jgi:riboflavin kinase/FMN adenylyltransferase
MRILDSIRELSELKGPIVLAVGTFDGVHLGHQALIRRAIEEASSCGGTAVVMTFDRHPASLLRPEKAPKLLTRNEEKISFMKDLGVSAMLMLEFTNDLSGVSPRDFIASLIASANTLHAFCVGQEWFFGKGGEGNASLLKLLGEELGFHVIQIDPVMAEGAPISSTRIRRAISAGNLNEATLCLGRPYLLMGRVIKGAGLGATIGFPTANLDVEGMQLPPDGVYVVRVTTAGLQLSGVCNIGVRPTVDADCTKRTFEVHLFDVYRDFVGKELSVEFVKFLRAEQKFSKVEALKGQIARDCEIARSFSLSH